jgi:hypothetical protein
LSSPPHWHMSSNPKFLSLVKMLGTSIVNIATGYGLDDQGVGFHVPMLSRIFSSPCCPDRLWGPPSHLSSGYWVLFPQG